MLKEQFVNGEIIAKRDEVTYLFSYGDDQARILHLDAKVMGAPMHVEAFLKMGYWEPYEGGVDPAQLLPSLRMESETGVLATTEENERVEAQCFVFRQSTSHKKELYKEIEKGRLRQGWGFAEGLSLLNGRDTFIDNFKQASSHWDATRLWATLSRMLQIKPGDIMIIPKQPDHHHFVIMQAKLREDGVSCYEFADPLQSTDDYRHIIHIDKASIQVVHYEALYPSIIKRLLKSIAYSSPVNVVRRKEFNEAIHTLLESATTSKELEEAHPLQIKMKEVEKKLHQEWVAEARNLPPSDFEKVVKIFMEANGFETERANHYDRLGGDIDLICKKEVPLHTPFEPSKMELIYYIQVKKHKGKTDETGVKQLNQMVDHLLVESGQNVQKILISLADDFSDTCKQLADESNVLLIDGLAFAEMYVKSEA
ncbi:restriction endonuclease [Bacillus sp. FJAT-45037]|uniref:restriction endonuclease n=1 Tax=Bacillus sp. FJAT-45037 TaxID=2011007 RepID=UPI000C243694|nr:restriction endonuclease [Bacillus sp. FJAT-45037]